MPNDDPKAPALLYLHGARRDVEDSALRIAQMRDLGFSVLAIDYRGFGRSKYDRATSRKRFVEVEGGTHSSTHRIGQALYRRALRGLFGLFGLATPDA